MGIPPWTSGIIQLRYPLINVMGHLMGHLNAAFKCSAYQLVAQNWYKVQSQSTYFIKLFWLSCPQTRMLIVFHTMPFAVTLSKALVHYYYMP